MPSFICIVLRMKTVRSLLELLLFFPSTSPHQSWLLVLLKAGFPNVVFKLLHQQCTTYPISFIVFSISSACAVIPTAYRKDTHVKNLCSRMKEWKRHVEDDAGWKHSDWNALFVYIVFVPHALSRLLFLWDLITAHRLWAGDSSCTLGQKETERRIWQVWAISSCFL